MVAESLQAFPHLSPSQSIRERYAVAFSDPRQVNRRSKNLFDRVFGGFALAVALPGAIILLLIHAILCALFESERGPILVSFNAISQGKLFRKFKFRVVRQSHVDTSAALAGDWRAYAAEWDPRCRTYLGRFLKKYYLDELPQILNIALGHMSFVGPRPLAVHHYHRDLSQGNVHRKIIKAGLFGPSQAQKGKTQYGVPDEEYKYLDAVMRMSAGRLLLYDIKLVFLGLVRVAEGKGL
jgi:lipopolysaccharide/colanic/teichoic acid biosynthesis glycosyltransferase